MLCDLLVVAVDFVALRCLRLPERTAVMLRPIGGVRDEVEGQTLTVSVEKEWRFGHTSYLSGKVTDRRIDGVALAPKPLGLNYCGEWDPREDFSEVLEHRRRAAVPDWVLDLVKAGVRREYEMEQVIPGADFSKSDYDPIIQAVDRRDCGDLDGAFRVLEECVERDSRCIDAYVHQFQSSMLSTRA